MEPGPRAAREAGAGLGAGAALGDMVGMGSREGAHEHEYAGAHPARTRTVLRRLLQVHNDHASACGSGRGVASRVPVTQAPQPCRERHPLQRAGRGAAVRRQAPARSPRRTRVPREHRQLVGGRDLQRRAQHQRHVLRRGPGGARAGWAAARRRQHPQDRWGGARAAGPAGRSRSSPPPPPPPQTRPARHPAAATPCGPERQSRHAAWLGRALPTTRPPPRQPALQVAHQSRMLSRSAPPQSSQRRPVAWKSTWARSQTRTLTRTLP
jgi:hypothetical protein